MKHRNYFLFNMTNKSYLRQIAEQHNWIGELWRTRKRNAWELPQLYWIYDIYINLHTHTVLEIKNTCLLKCLVHNWQLWKNIFPLKWIFKCPEIYSYNPFSQRGLRWWSLKKKALKLTPSHLRSDYMSGWNSVSLTGIP